MKMKLSIMLTAVVLVLLPSAQICAQRTGTSHPEELDDTLPTVPVDGTHYVKPSPAVPMATTVTVATPAPPVPAPVLYQHKAAAALPPTQTASLRATDTSRAIPDDVDGRIVINVPVGPHELPIGTTLKATLQQPISTQTTVAGTRFSAVLSTDIGRNGMVLLPAGSLVYGRITQIHGGRLIGGSSAIRLQPDSISLPDGTTYKLNAEVTNLDHYDASHVNDEGTIVGNTNPTATGAAAVGLTTTSAVVAGAMIGGGVGAVVGLGIGAGVATVWWLKRDRQQDLPSGTEIAFTLNNSLQLNPATH